MGILMENSCKRYRLKRDKIVLRFSDPQNVQRILYGNLVQLAVVFVNEKFCAVANFC